MAKCRIVADENIPQVAEWFAGLGEVRTLPGRSLSAAAVSDADILLVRSVTRVDANLLAGSRVRMVGTATIGTDHLDLDYLAARGIAVESAPGSNAWAVVDYVLSSLCALPDVPERLLGGGSVSIVGLGNVGGRLLQRLQRLGVRCVGFDPLLSQTTGLPLVALEQALAADVVCLHTPLTRGGAFPTWHLLDRARIDALRPGTVLINAGRGAVVDNAALRDRLERRGDLPVVLDVWEQEPEFDPQLLAAVAIGTPHIAGYSLDGKLAGTRMMLKACCRFLGVPQPVLPAAGPALEVELDPGLEGADLLRAVVRAVYDVRRDDAALRAAAIDAPGPALGVAFDRLRKHYPVRRELGAVEVINWAALTASAQVLLSALGCGRAGR